MAKEGYTGKISNAGAQIVQAPIKPSGGKKGGKVKTGNDLRTGGK